MVKIWIKTDVYFLNGSVSKLILYNIRYLCLRSLFRVHFFFLFIFSPSVRFRRQWVSICPWPEVKNQRGHRKKGNMSWIPQTPDPLYKQPPHPPEYKGMHTPFRFDDGGGPTTYPHTPLKGQFMNKSSTIAHTPRAWLHRTGVYD